MNYFPQYTLQDLDAMPPSQFWYLVGGMLDNTNPQATESHQEEIRRKTEAQAKKAMAKASPPRRGW